MAHIGDPGHSTESPFDARDPLAWATLARAAEESIRPARSEIELQSHLDGSSAHSRTGDRAESGRRGDVARWWREARVVRQVEELGPKQEIPGLGNVEL